MSIASSRPRQTRLDNTGGRADLVDNASQIRSDKTFGTRVQTRVIEWVIGHVVLLGVVPCVPWRALLVVWVLQKYTV